MSGDGGRVAVCQLLLGLMDRPEWQRQAACRSMDAALFFPERGEPVRPARETCACCPVISECAEAGRRERFGVWGGLSDRERRAARRRNRR